MQHETHRCSNIQDFAAVYVLRDEICWQINIACTRSTIQTHSHSLRHTAPYTVYNFIYITMIQKCQISTPDQRVPTEVCNNMQQHKM